MAPGLDDHTVRFRFIASDNGIARAFESVAAKVATMRAHVRGMGKDYDDASGRTKRFAVTIEHATAKMLAMPWDILSKGVKGFVGGLAGAIPMMLRFVPIIAAVTGAIVVLVAAAQNAALVIGGGLVAAVGQAIPVLGLLVAGMMRVSAAFKASSAILDEHTQRQVNATAISHDHAAAMYAIAQAAVSVTDATKAMTVARRDATRQLQDMAAAEKAARLQVEQADFSLSRARKGLQDASRGGDLAAVVGAGLDVQGAQQGVAGARLAAGRSEVDLAAAQRKGVDGSAQVVQARRQLASATHALAEANYAATTQEAALGKAAKDALAALSPTERQLATSLVTLRQTAKKVFRPITDEIVKPFTKITEELTKLIEDPVIQSKLLKLAKAIGDSLGKVGEFLVGDKSKKTFLEPLLDAATTNVPILTDALLKLADALARVAKTFSKALNDGKGGGLLPSLTGQLGNFDKFVANGGDKPPGRFNNATGQRTGGGDSPIGSVIGDGLGQLTALGSLLGSTIALVEALAKLFDPAGVQSGGGVTGLADAIKRLANGIDTHAPEIQHFFETLGKVLDTLADILGKSKWIFDHLKSAVGLIPGVGGGGEVVGAIVLLKVFQRYAIAWGAAAGRAFYAASRGLPTGGGGGGGGAPSGPRGRGPLEGPSERPRGGVRGIADRLLGRGGPRGGGGRFGGRLGGAGGAGALAFFFLPKALSGVGMSDDAIANAMHGGTFELAEVQLAAAQEKARNTARHAADGLKPAASGAAEQRRKRKLGSGAAQHDHAALNAGTPYLADFGLNLDAVDRKTKDSADKATKAADTVRAKTKESGDSAVTTFKENTTKVQNRWTLGMQDVADKAKVKTLDAAKSFESFMVMITDTISNSPVATRFNNAVGMLAARASRVAETAASAFNAANGAGGSTRPSPVGGPNGSGSGGGDASGFAFASALNGPDDDSGRGDTSGDANARKIEAATAAANSLDKQWPYAWGGGHANPPKPSSGHRHDPTRVAGGGRFANGKVFDVGYDCSGTVSAILNMAGIWSGGRAAAGFMQAPFKPGKGRKITLHPSSGHVWMEINGRAFGTGRKGYDGGPAWGNSSGGSSYHLPGFNTGGMIDGEFDGADDVPVRVSRGEAILNPRQIAMLGRSRVMGVLRDTGGKALRAGGAYASGGGNAALISKYLRYAKEFAKRYNLDPRAMAAVAFAESGLDPNSIGDGGTSFGYHQLHIGGALGNISRSAARKYLDPRKNLELTARLIASAGGGGLRGAAAINQIVRKFERPAAPGAEVARALSFYNDNKGVGSSSGDGGGGGGGGTSGGSATNAAAVKAKPIKLRRNIHHIFQSLFEALEDIADIGKSAADARKGIRKLKDGAKGAGDKLIGLLLQANDAVSQFGETIGKVTAARRARTRANAFTVKRTGDGTFSISRNDSDDAIAQKDFETAEQERQLLLNQQNLIRRNIRVAEQKARKLKKLIDKTKSAKRKAELRKELEAAKAAINAGGVQLGENANALADSGASLAEQQEALQRGVVDRANQKAGRANAALERRKRLLQASGKGGSLAGIFDAEADVIRTQKTELSAALVEATKSGNVKLVAEITDQLADLDVSLAENATAKIQSQIDVVNKTAQTGLSNADIDKRLADAGIVTDADGNIISQNSGAGAGLADVAGQRRALNERGDALNTQRTGLQTQLAEALAAGNTELVASLREQLKANTLAIYDNTQELKNLGQTELQGFQSSAWSLFRSAVFNGIGGLMPQFAAAVPQMATGGSILRDGLIRAHAGEVILNKTDASSWQQGGNNVTVNIDQAGADLDVEYLSRRLAWEMNL